MRSGEDYLAVHEWAAAGRTPTNQAEFDQGLAALGPEAQALRKARLYQVRDELLARDRPQWLAWNPLYPGVAEALGTQATNPGVVILSTKKAEFIAEILTAQGVAWPRERIFYTGPHRKLDLIAAREAAGEAPVGSELIDDQIDHLDFDHPTCRCRLALWGYLGPGAAEAARDRLTLDEALARIRAFPAPDRVG